MSLIIDTDIIKEKVLSSLNKEIGNIMKIGNNSYGLIEEMLSNVEDSDIRYSIIQLMNNTSEIEEQMKKMKEELEQVVEKVKGIKETKIPPFPNNLEKFGMTILNELYDNLNKIVDSSSSSPFSDYEDITINKFSQLVCVLSSKFDKKSDYNKLRRYLTGKKVKDIFNDDGTLKKLDASSEDIINLGITPEECERINNTINEFKVIEFSEDDIMKEFTITEIVLENSGYDAVVLQSPSGDYMICSSHTNSEDPKDIAAIMYPLLNYIFDDKLLAKYLGPIALNFSGIVGDELLDPEGSYYQSQLIDCKNLIKKYSNKAKYEGKNVDLFGYSLGGGILITSYSLLQIENNYDNIDSVTVYNPYLLYASGYETNNFLFMDGIDQDDIINQLKNDKKVTIFSAEYDVVSTLNDFQDDLKDKIVYVPAEHTSLNESANSKDFVLNIKALYNFIIGSEGTHGLNWTKNSDILFDENGNLVKVGEYQNINEVFSVITGGVYTGNGSSSPDVQHIFQTVLRSSFPEKIKISIGGNTVEMDLSKPLDYLCTNLNNFNRVEFLEKLAIPIKEFLESDCGKNLLRDQLKDMNPLFEDLINYAVDDDELIDAIIDSLCNLLKKDANFEKTLQVLVLLSKNETNYAFNILINELLKDNIIKLKDDLLGPLKKSLLNFLETKEGKKLLFNAFDDNAILFLIVYIFKGSIINFVEHLLDNDDELCEAIFDEIMDNNFSIDRVLILFLQAAGRFFNSR